MDQAQSQENKMMGKEAGLSLVELMVVIAMIAILSAIAVPNYVAWLPKYRLSTSARDVLSDLEYARSVAIKENASVVVEFDTANNSFRVWVDNGAATNTDNWTQTATNQRCAAVGRQRAYL